MYFGVSILFFIKIFFEISLSIAIDDAIIPECVYGIFLVSKMVWIYPSSPNCPCSALKIISGLNKLISFDKFLSGSLIKTLYPFLINSLATYFPVSKLISRSLDMPPDNIKIFFFILF